jgi:hypothetical protein
MEPPLELLLLRFGRFGLYSFVDCTLRITLYGGLLHKATSRSGPTSFAGHYHLLVWLGDRSRTLRYGSS